MDNKKFRICPYNAIIKSFYLAFVKKSIIFVIYLFIYISSKIFEWPEKSAQLRVHFCQILCCKYKFVLTMTLRTSINLKCFQGCQV